MDVGDISDPNLDGDFKTLLEVRQNRERNKRPENDDYSRLLEEFHIQHNESDTYGLTDLLESLNPARTSEKSHTISNANDKPSVQGSSDAHTNKLRVELFEAALSDDVENLRILRHEVSSLRMTLSHTALCDVIDRSTVLHAALRNDKWEAAKYLIQSCDVSFLSLCYDVTIRNLPSKKSCLHIITEKGNYELAKFYLEQFKDKDKLSEVLAQTVLTEFEDQRPRELSSMHIAALHGHTELVDLYHQLGVDVNVTNNKNDTPILWAVRGNHIQTVQRLIHLRARMDLENDKGSTPLYWAVRYGYADLVEVLITEGKASVHRQRKLGLVSPIVLASALGYDKIVDILLSHGADASTKIKNDQTALHVAAAEGNDRVVLLLLTKGNADVNHADTNGNTALLFAAKAGHINTMKILLAKGAKVCNTNKVGQSLWDFAMQYHDSRILSKVAALHRQYSVDVGSERHSGSTDLPKSSNLKLSFRVGRTPLHSSAAAGDIPKIRSLLDLGADPYSLDLNGNTYLHIAALNDRHEVIKEFLREVDVETANADGNTALHLAAKQGHVQSVMELLQKAKLEARNKQGMTALHLAAESDQASAEVISILVEGMVKASNWSLVDARDSRGNTALHLAARRGKYELFPELIHLNAAVKNDSGDTPFHLAARSGVFNCLEKMLRIFNRPEKGVNVDQVNMTGESTLHECVRIGDTLGVELLVSCGGDLSLQNKLGDSPLHLLIELCSLGASGAERRLGFHTHEQSLSSEQALQVYRTVVACSTRWWCMKKDLLYPIEASELYYSYLRSAVIHLTSQIFNAEGLNILTMATSLTATTLLDEILNTPNVYRFREVDDYIYDVTYLTPETVSLATKRRISRGFSGGYDRSLSVAKVSPEVLKVSSEIDYSSHDIPSQFATIDSCLDIVITNSDEVTASKILDINPFRILVSDYWSTYQWIFTILLVIHIVYMSLFSVFVMPTSSQLSSRFNASDSDYGACRSGSGGGAYGLFLIWPILILMFEAYIILEEIVTRGSRGCHKSQRNIDETQSDTESIKKRQIDESEGESFWRRHSITVLGLPYRVLTGIFNYLSHATAIAFAALVIAWYCLFLCDTAERRYVEVVSMILLLGWLFTISFSKGFEELHAYTIMLRYIVIRDISKFILIYIFVLMACGLAFNALFQLSADVVRDYPTSWHTVFGTFNLMLGMGSMLDNGFDDVYSQAGGNPEFVKKVYIFYVLIANVILLSLLIAMMTDTYTEIKSTEALTWRVGSLRLALRVERALPWLKKALRALRLSQKRISYDTEVNRWILKVSARKVLTPGYGSEARPENEEMITALQRLEDKLDKIGTGHAELLKQMEMLCHQISLNDQAGQDRALRRHAPSLYSVARRLRERPFSAEVKSKAASDSENSSKGTDTESRPMLNDDSATNNSATRRVPKTAKNLWHSVLR